MPANIFNARECFYFLLAKEKTIIMRGDTHKTEQREKNALLKRLFSQTGKIKTIHAVHTRQYLFAHLTPQTPC